MYTKSVGFTAASVALPKRNSESERYSKYKEAGNGFLTLQPNQLTLYILAQWQLLWAMSQFQLLCGRAGCP